MATAGDAPRVDELRAAAAAEIGGRRGGRMLRAELEERGPVAARLADGVDGEREAVAVGLLDGLIVGYGSARVVELRGGERLGVLEELYVEPGARQVGVGEALMQTVTAWCVGARCRGMDGVALPGDRTAKGFFERHGMVARALVMHRPLPPV